MDEQRKLKRIIYLGAAIGAVLSITISLLLDVLYADALQGTWRDAIVHDLDTFLSLSVGRDSFLVTTVFIIILSVLGLFGAFMGMIFSFFVYKFFSFLLRDDKA
jgi:hypothetical protein